MHKIPVQIKDSQGKVKSKIIRIKAMQNRLFTGNEILQLREEKRERKQSNWSVRFIKKLNSKWKREKDKK